MADLAVIGLGVDARGLKQGEVALDQFAVKGERTEQRVNKSMGRVGKGVEKAGKSATSGGDGFRNLSLQLNQVAQQGSITGNYMQALAVGLPDIMLGFGGLGIVLGTVAGTLVPVILGFFAAGDSAKEMEDAIDTLSDSIKEYKRAVDGADFDSLLDTFGAITPEIVELARELQALKMQEILLDAAAAVGTLSGQFKAGFFSTAEQQIKKTLGVTIEQAERLEYLFRQIGNADTLSGQLAALDDFQAGIVDAVGGIDNMDKSQIEFYNSTLDAERALRAAEIAAGGVASRVGDAATNAAAFAASSYDALNAISLQNQRDSKVYSGRGGNPARFENGSGQAASVVQSMIDAATKKSRGGGGGPQIDPRIREAEQVFNSTRTAAEKYKAEIDDLNELQDLGYLSADTYARAVKTIGDEYREAANESTAFEDSILSIADGTMSASDAFDALKDAIKRAALEYLFFGKGAFAGGGGVGGIVSGLLGSVFGGFKADGGPVTGGKAHIVGERGPELFIPQGSGSITPNNALGGGTVTVIVQASEDLRVTAAQAGQGAAVQVVQAGFQRQRQEQRRR